jgi:hypothetical protein
MKAKVSEMREIPSNGITILREKVANWDNPSVAQKSMIVELMELNNDIVMKKMNNWNIAWYRLFAFPSASPGTAKHAATDAVIIRVETNVSVSTLSL